MHKYLFGFGKFSLLFDAKFSEMVNQKSAAFVITSCIVIYTFYYNMHFNHAYKIDTSYELKEVKKRQPIYVYNGTEDFLINTRGCYIPNYGKTLVFNESVLYKSNCGERAIFIKRVENNNIIFRVDNNIMKKVYSKRKDIGCCYRFASRSKTPKKEDTQLSYTDCEPFKNGAKVRLTEEVITVTCTSPPDKSSSLPRIIYEDAYVLIKKVETKAEPINEEEKKRWNILILGMDTMSRARLLSSMPDTVKYFHSHGWLDYKGYQKVGPNTFPNLMAIFTGKKLGAIYKECEFGMTKCNNLMIWSKYSKAGYITAYGEDYLNLPDTFARYKGFQTPPTHHYMRPFFLTGEKKIGNLICAKHKPSAKHLLDYASEFANTYKNEKFFGTFWLNSYSHNLNNVPTLLDKDMVSFFKELNSTEVMNNTIIIFLSDHGIRFGDMRIPMESYYEERLPMLFIWIPHQFRKLYGEEYYNLQFNQNRLVTAYDLHVTLTKISNMSKNSTDSKSEACPQCTSLFEAKSADRTCADAGVDDKWCTCHAMTKVASNDIGANTSLQVAVNYIKNRSNSIETINCMACHSLQLDSVLRSYSYKDNNKTHYVVAWQMSPGNVSFEATVVEDGTNYTILQPTDTISAYNTRGNCVKNANDRPFCVCKSVHCSSKVEI